MPKFQVGDYVKLTPEWADELEHSRATCKEFRPYIYSSFAIKRVQPTGCYIQPIQAGRCDRFWFGFNKLRVDPFLGNAQKAIRDAQ